MMVFRSLLAGLGLTLAVVSAQAQAPAPATPERQYPTSSLGITAGWGAPYGWSLDYSRMLTPQLDVNAGVGIGIGSKIGLGTRYYFAPQRRVSPFVGANLVYTGRTQPVALTIKDNTGTEEQTRVGFKATSLLHLRGGVRWQTSSRFSLLGALGHGIRLNGNPVEYVPGFEPTRQSTRDIVDLIAPGGIEISVGVAFGIGG